jgi:hypothetical protein
MHFRPAAAWFSRSFLTVACLLGVLLATGPPRPRGRSRSPQRSPRARSDKEQALVTDHKKREALLFQIQQLVHERVRFGPLWEYVWPSGVGPRVEEPALMLINPYPWSAPLEEVRLKKK